MGKCRLVLVTALAFLLEAWVLAWFPLWGVRPRLLPALAGLVGTEEGPRLGGGLWIAGGRFVHPGGGFPLSDGPADPGRGAFRGSFPPNGLLLGKMAGQPGHPNGDGGSAGAGPRPGGGGAAGPPGHRRAGAPPRRGGVSGGVSPHPAEKAPGAEPGRRALWTGCGVNPAAWGRGAPGPSSVRRTVGTGAGSTLRGGAGGRPRSWVPYRRWGLLPTSGRSAPGGACRRPPFLL